jgi:hypothetical protein
MPVEFVCERRKGGSSEFDDMVACGCTPERLEMCKLIVRYQE